MEVYKRDAFWPPDSDNYEPATEVVFDPSNPWEVSRREALLGMLEAVPPILGLNPSDDRFARAGGIMLRGIMPKERLMSFLVHSSRVDEVVNPNYL